MLIADDSGGFYTVQNLHPNVHKHNVRHRCTHGIYGDLAIFSHLYRSTNLSQNLRQNLSVFDDVVYNKGDSRHRGQNLSETYKYQSLHASNRQTQTCQK